MRERYISILFTALGGRGGESVSASKLVSQIKQPKRFSNILLGGFSSIFTSCTDLITFTHSLPGLNFRLSRSPKMDWEAFPPRAGCCGVGAQYAPHLPLRAPCCTAQARNADLLAARVLSVTQVCSEICPTGPQEWRPCFRYSGW